MSQNLLAIESSGQQCSVALLLNGKQVHCKSASLPRKHAELILPMISELMHAHNISAEQLSYIAFGEGPGNFTGIRLSASIVQGLAFGWNKPVLPVATLKSMALAAGLKHQIDKVIVAMDARKQEISYGAFELLGKQKIKVIHPVRIFSPDALVLPESDGWLAIGNAWTIYQEALLPEANKVGKNKISQFDHGILPDAAMIAELALQEYQSNPSQLLPAERALPQYFRESV